jgi:hypothetical protein
MPGVWLLDETYDYDAASQNFATHAAEARRQESGSAPGIRVTVTTTPGSPKRPRARGGPRPRRRRGGRRGREGSRVDGRILEVNIEVCAQFFRI